MSDAMSWLLSADRFMPHGHCFLWEPSTLWLNVGSDALIAGSYFAIPLAIYYFIRRRPSDIRYAWVPLTFAAFILLCGATHIMEIWTVWNPLYRVAGVLKLITGVVSFATLLSLVWIMPRAVLLKTPTQLQAEVEARTAELNEVNAQLRGQIAVRDSVEGQLRVAEQEHARAAALLQTIVESAPGLIYAKDRDGRMLLANPPALDLIGKSWSEVEGRTDIQFLDDRSQAEMITQNDRRLMDANRTEVLEEAIGIDGGEERVWISTKAPLRTESGAVIGLVGVSVEITERKRLEYRLRLMVDELNHRVKNTLAAVQAIALQTLRTAHADLYDALQVRLLSLAAAHDVLTREGWVGADLHEIVTGQLVPKAGAVGNRFQLSGPKIKLNSKASLALSLGLNELATNALKYGALVNETGRVQVTWEVADTAPRLLRLKWVESGGPPVRAPERRGFGRKLIETIMARDLSGVVRLDFDDPNGLTCWIEAPVSEITPASGGVRFPRIGAALGSVT
jgi:PAS domain S-box-containing protein